MTAFRQPSALLAFILALLPFPALAAGEAAHLDGAALELFWGIPFAGLLLSIAIFPLVAEHFWHKHFGKISAFWALAFLVPATVTFGPAVMTTEVLHALLLEYVPFILLLLALFTVAGGVRLRGSLRGTPAVNTLILLVGTAIASWMGTTGAAMLLIRPLLRANEWRTHRVHTVVFFIFLVANIGGSLTPLGDPPLFLGFLQGVPFFWPTRMLLVPMLLLSAILLVVYFLLDSWYYRREGAEPAPAQTGADSKLGLEGLVNIPLLAAIIAAVLMSGVWKPGGGITISGVMVTWQALARDGLLLAIAILSWLLTDHRSRTANGFSWFPIQEVAKLFAGIFITIIPVLTILKAGADGALSGAIDLVSRDGQPVDMMYFWITGLLSAFLDNAPTYLVFYNTAGGDAALLTGQLAGTLLAISCGAVFMGAYSYIGNAPNFMVRSIASERGVPMPSFFGYMVWSGIFLTPCFVLVSWLFF